MFARAALVGRRYLCTRAPVPVAVQEGEFGTKAFCIYAQDPHTQKRVSWWHDVALHPTSDKSIVHMVVEMPKNSNAKMEIEKDLPHNPIVQDTKKGKLRWITYGNSHYNYGAIPQTFEDPTVPDSITGINGDNDPLDVVEVGAKRCEMGDVIQVRVLGALGLVDDGETDWKVIALNLQDEMADRVKDLHSLETHMPGVVDKIRDWYRCYKTADGLPENTYALDGQAQDEKIAADIIQETHELWKVRVNTE